MLSQRTLPTPPPPSPLLIRSPCPAVPFPAPAICIYSEEAAAASEKKREFLSFIRRFPRNPHSPAPISCTSLFIYVHIFLSCRRRKDFFCETHTATGELDALLGSARETEKELRQRQERGSIWGGGSRERRDGTVCNGYTNFQPTQFFALISFLFLRLPRDTAARGGNKNFFFRFSLQQQQEQEQQPFAPVLHLCPFLLQVCLCCACAPECFFRIFNLKCECAWGWENTTRL